MTTAGRSRPTWSGLPGAWTRACRQGSGDAGPDKSGETATPGGFGPRTYCVHGTGREKRCTVLPSGPVLPRGRSDDWVRHLKGTPGGRRSPAHHRLADSRPRGAHDAGRRLPITNGAGSGGRAVDLRQRVPRDSRHSPRRGSEGKIRVRGNNYAGTAVAITTPRTEPDTGRMMDANPS